MSEIIKLNYDIVIIGSGAGGGTVAKELSELCKKGIKIALLELGARFKPEDNTREEQAMVRQYYFKSGGFQTTSMDMTLAFAKGVGGSTNVYTGVTFKLPESAVKKWNVKGINLDDLNPRMDKYIKENGAHFEQPENINKNNQCFKLGCEKLNWHVEQFAINTRNCVGLATCNLGCAKGAKQGTAIIQIPEAERNGVEVITHCKVNRIDGNEVIADITHSDASSQHVAGQYSINAKKIIVCAGAINTSAILLRSFGEKFNPLIGRYLTCHPASIMVAEHEDQINSTEGPPKNYYSDQFVKSDRFLLESCMYFPFSFARTLTGFGENVDEILHRYPYLQMTIALILDEAYQYNRVAIDKNGEPKVHYKLNKEIQSAFVKASIASAQLMFAAGAKRVHVPGSKQFFINRNELDRLDEIIHAKYFKLGQATISSAHLMGGCKMGESAENSVTNSWGKVHGFDHIYIADGSLFPACSEVNPYLTIMALADRVAEGIKKDW